MCACAWDRERGRETERDRESERETEERKREKEEVKGKREEGGGACYHMHVEARGQLRNLLSPSTMWIPGLASIFIY